MIGNDVIDLGLAQKESNWKRSGFLEKLFTKAEQQLILGNANPELMVWNLWSRKEAAYKIYNRETGVRAFMPLQLECFYENIRDGKVVVKDRQYFTETFLSVGKIHTLAVSDSEDFSKIISLDNVADVVKKNGIPFIGSGKKPVSISHHGRFSAIVTLK